MTMKGQGENPNDSERERPTPTVEDYLGVIYVLARDGQAVISRRLVEWMEVSPPTVTATVQRMVRDGWVTMAEDKSIHLTEAGRGAAASVVRRHMLTELLLARVLGVPWSRVHEEAHKLEHDFTAETTTRVAQVVSETSVCPHGNPLPGYEMLTDELTPLLEAEPGRRYILARVHEEVERDPQLMAFLEERCMVPGVEVEVIAVLPFNALGTTRCTQRVVPNAAITVHAAGHEVVLGLSVAAHLWVSEL
jgi:DtxR family Mn-dependent transcriptional regulator